MQVDIVSFGVTFYEIITGGLHPYGDFPFQSQLDTMILNKQPINKISKYGCLPWTDIENLIQKCLHPNPGSFFFIFFLYSLNFVEFHFFEFNICC